MDFDKLDLGKGDASRWVHLAPGGEALYYDGKGVTTKKTDKPCRVSLRAATSNEVYHAFRKYQNAERAYQARLSRAKDKEIDKLAAGHNERAEGLMDDVIVAALDGFENIYIAGEEAKVSREAILTLIDREASAAKRMIRAQIFEAITADQEAFTDAAQG